MEKQIYEFDTIILGGGPAGLSAAIYSARGENKTAIIDITMLGGQPSNYLELENYPGFSVIGGYDLMEKFEEHVDKFGVEKFPMEEIQSVDLNSSIKTIETIERIFKAKAVILATGAQPKKLGVVGEKELAFIGDYKTTATLHKEAVAWQLSLYAFLQSNVIYEKYFCFHFPDKDTCKLVELQPIPEQEIIKLLEAERNCEIYQKRTLELTEADTDKIVTVQRELKSIDDRKKELEKIEAELKSFLIEKMEETGVKSIDNDYFRITYVAPFTRETIDGARLKKEQPEIAGQYLKTSVTNASVKITLKDI